MSTILTRNVQDLSTTNRENLEQLLGTRLQARERVHIVVESPPEGPAADVKLLAAQRIRQIIAQAEAHAEQGIPDGEIDSAVEEAMAHVRQRDWMRVVLDTNVLARAVPGRTSPARQLLERLLAPTHVLASSPMLLDELARVLRYDRVRAIHGLDDPAIDAYVESIRTASLVITIASPPPVAGDPDDDFVIATAVDGQADVLCTWDRHLYAEAVAKYLEPLGVRVLRDVDLLQELPPQNP